MSQIERLFFGTRISENTMGGVENDDAISSKVSMEKAILNLYTCCMLCERKQGTKYSPEGLNSCKEKVQKSVLRVETYSKWFP